MALPGTGLNPSAHPHRIGPNAITRVAEALRQRQDADEIQHLFALAGIEAYLLQPPEKMVDEREVARLHQVLRAELGIESALAVAREAGVRTGDYLLAHRIPRGVQVLLKRLPARLASRVLLNAIQRHAWTFAGSGELRLRKPYPPRLAIAGCCICQGARAEVPLCDFYAAAIERLFQKLVHPRARVMEIGCQALGQPACTFQMSW